MKYVFLFFFPMIASALPDDLWIDQNNHPVKLSSLKNVVISMAYTGCAHTCPLIIETMQDIKDKAVGKKLTYVIASMDYKNESVKKVKNYMKTRKLDEKEWIFMVNNNKSQVEKLAKELNMTFSESRNKKDYTHNNVIAYIDESGKIAGRTESLTTGAKEISEKIGK